MLLATKFLRPAHEPKAVQRDRLQALLARRPGKRLNLVVAPAGYGKTTLVNQWCETLSHPLAWLSLDENDNEPRRFWQYLAGALQHAGITTDEAVAQQLNQLPQHGLEPAITLLINSLASRGKQPVTLVLDDFHAIADSTIHRQLAYFIDYLPPQIMLTLTSRIEPDLPLAKWRVRNQVDELHPRLLQFSEQECLSFLRDFMSLEVSEAEANALCRRTEGWVAAMQLAALARKGETQTNDNTPLGIDSRQISDFVLAEILQQQPEALRSFLLDTACCVRLNASLCNAVRQAKDSQTQLASLTQRNLFLIPLDTHHEWFRYHDLFRDALYQRLQHSDPERLDLLQRRATQWLLDHGHIHEAIAQIIQRQDWATLGEVLAHHGNNLIHGGFHLPVLEWLERLPPALESNSPRLQMLRIWALFFANRLEPIEPRLSQLEDILDTRVADSHPDAEGALALHSEVSLIRSYLARSRSDLDSAQNLTQQVLKDLDHTRIPLKSVTYYGLGLDYFGRGDLPQAANALQSAVEYGKLERQASTVMSSGGLLAWIQFNRGSVSLALDTCREVRRWVDEHYDDPKQPRLISCWQNSTLVEIYRERNEPDLAAGYLAPLLDHLQAGTEPGQHVIIQYVRARLAYTRGQYAEAMTALDDAIHISRERGEHIMFEPPNCEALRARCLLALGRQREAEAWLTERDQHHWRNPLNREQAIISAARVSLASGQPQQAIALLNPLRLATEQGQHVRHLIELLCVYAQALAAEGKQRDAEHIAEQALVRAAESGFMRLFAEEPPAMHDLIRALHAPHLPDAWFNTLKAMLGNPKATTPSPASEPLPEPLSQREIEVLDLIHAGLANKDIADRMQVAPTTVKAHIRNLYGKIGARSRTEALARARQLGLLSQ
ncbi:MAG: LuxR C-terminal-related transcriptional regulator [Marinobacter sp.]|nr:LuxR C-terminal-related transcriptional regulator [Marinobacter sp.]